MIRFLKRSLVFSLLFGLLIIAACSLFSENRPKALPSAEADLLADTMIAAVGGDAWQDIRYIRWNFAGRHHYIWDKKENLIHLKMNDERVVLNGGTQKGHAYVDDKEVFGEEAADLLKTAWSNFCNDSWWLNPVVKAKDAGTTRSLVTLEDGRKGLMVQYDSGGVTPGDAYVWLLDSNNRPFAYKMWVSIIPIGGLEASWSDWVRLPGGAWVSQRHEVGPIDLAISEIKAGASLAEINAPAELFQKLMSGVDPQM